LTNWGRDFRPAFRKLDILKANFPNIPILAMTATATKTVKEDIIEVLNMKNVLDFQNSFNRTNLIYEVKDKKRDYVDYIHDIAKIIKDKYKKESGIVYCLARKDCENVVNKLQKGHGISCVFYHAGLTLKERNFIQEEWMENHIQVIVATIAFGLGINKQDVRFVFHVQMPKSLENYC
jgi:bloom syndrome protein